MIKKMLLIITLLVTALNLGGCCCCCCSPNVRTSRVAREVAGEVVHSETHGIDLGGATAVHVYLRLDGGTLDLKGGGEKLFEGRFAYSDPKLQPQVDYEVQAGQGKLRVIQADGVGSNRSADMWRNEWQVRLGTDVPIDLEADVGDGKGEMDLGGMHLRSFHLSAGSADIKVRFSESNPEPLSLISVRTGASRMSFYDLGNANMDGFRFDGGVGTYLFDFGGKWQRSAVVSIKAGTGRVALHMPRDIGVRVCPGSTDGKSCGGLHRDRDCYVNSLYRESAIRLDVNLDIGVGSLEIR